MKRVLLIISVLLLASLACVDTVQNVILTTTAGAPTPRPPDPTATKFKIVIPEISEYEAEETLRSYAQDVLGISLENIIARQTESDFTLPIGQQQGLDAAAEISGATYFGIFEDGLGALSLGAGTISGDVEADIRDASLGIFTFRIEQIPPDNETEALAIILAAFPGVAGLEFEPAAAETGYAFRSINTENDIELSSGQITLSGGAVSAGVVPGPQQGASWVWVAVAAGDFAAALEQFLP